MALDLSKLNFFSRLDARARVMVLFGGVLGVIGLVYLATLYFSGGSNAVGPSRVASAPTGMQSIPGGNTSSAEYQRALNQANLQRAEAAKMSGTSAIPTQINTGISNIGGSCVICSDKSADVKNYLDQWVREGKISPDVANDLQDLANKNVSVEQYSANLDKLVKEGKITPEQARILLEEYKKEHTNAGLNESAKVMDDLIKSGKLPIDVANQLLDDQRNHMSTSDYAATLQRLVKEGKISQAVAQQLMGQYTKQCIDDASAKNLAFIQQVAGNGALTQEVANKVTDLTNKNASVDEYSSTLNKYVAAGKLTPDAAGKLVDNYRQGKMACGATGTISALLTQAENDAYQEISDLLAGGKITPEVAAQLTNMIQSNISTDDFKTAISTLVQQKKMTPDIAQLKVGDYVKVKQLREEQEKLGDLQANNVTPEQYAAELKRAVAAGIITPEEAARLMQEYQGVTAQAVAPIAGTGAFAALQQKVREGNANLSPQQAAGEFAVAQTQTVTETAQERQARLGNIMSQMDGQAAQLIASWQPVNMEHKEGAPPSNNRERERGAGAGENGSLGAGGIGQSTSSQGATGLEAVNAPVLIKGGTVLFAVLDTAINSDYPDSPIMATVVDGQHKGAKLLGKITTAKSVSGQLDRVSLTFTIMNEDAWPKSKTITAYGIDPDTARTVLASTVDYHYMMRFGAIMATSFMQGYASSITNAGSSTTGIFGTSTTHPALNSSSKLLVGLGQVGTTLGTATQNYVNRAPTVRVDSGVGLGILFMSDLS